MNNWCYNRICAAPACFEEPDDDPDESVKEPESPANDPDDERIEMNVIIIKFFNVFTISMYEI